MLHWKKRRVEAAMKMLVGSHQGRDADGSRERHNTQSSGDARCHDRQTATEVRWVSLLSGKKWRGKGWLRRGEGNDKFCKGTMRTLGWASLAHCRQTLFLVFSCIFIKNPLSLLWFLFFTTIRIWYVDFFFFFHVGIQSMLRGSRG